MRVRRGEGTRGHGAAAVAGGRPGQAAAADSGHERTFARPGAPLERAEVLGERVALRRLAGPAGTAWVGLHGLGSDGRDLLEVARLAGGPALLVDLPGFGASSRPDRAYPVARAAEVVRALLDLLRIERPVWLGCSYGAHVALRAALSWPGRVAGLVLAGAGGLDPAPPAALASLFTVEALRDRPPGAVAASCDALAARRNDLTEAFRSRRLRAHDAPGRELEYRAIARSALGALADDAALHLERIAAPVELVHGERDPLVSLEVVRAAARRLPRAALTVLPATGHMPWLEDPAAVAARVRRLLAGIDGDRRVAG